MDIVFRYQAMADAAAAVRGYKAEYETAADTFKAAMAEATKEWEGASKEKFLELINGSVYERIHTSLPDMVEAIAKTLDSNAEQMKAADEQIAGSIPDSV